MEVIPRPMAEAAKTLAKLKAKKEKLKEQLKAVDADITKAETVDLPKLMEDNEIESFKIKGVGTIYLTQDMYVNVLKDDRPKVYKWLRDQGNQAMITDWVFPNTLQAHVKSLKEDQAENGVNDENRLPDFIKVTVIPTANIRRSK